MAEATSMLCVRDVSLMRCRLYRDTTQPQQLRGHATGLPSIAERWISRPPAAYTISYTSDELGQAPAFHCDGMPNTGLYPILQNSPPGFISYPMGFHEDSIESQGIWHLFFREYPWNISHVYFPHGIPRGMEPRPILCRNATVHASNNVEATLSNATSRTILSTKSKQCSIWFDFAEGTKLYDKLVGHSCRFWQQSRMLLRHCFWCGRGLMTTNRVMYKRDLPVYVCVCSHDHFQTKLYSI